MERVVHRVVGVHLVDQPQLDLIADTEAPVDRVVGGARFSIDEAPMHVRRRRDPVDVDHVVFPLDAISVAVLLVALVVLRRGRARAPRARARRGRAALRAVVALSSWFAVVVVAVCAVF